MKTVKQYFVELIDAELPAFAKVFEALPADTLDWKPDPRSRSAIELASDLAAEPGQLAEVIKTGVMDFDPSKKHVFSSTAEAVEAIKAGAEQVKQAASALSDEEWESEAVMKVNGQDMWKTTRGDMAFGFLLDMIHHRGQLAVYIRPMGGKVPSIYGPSADSNG